MEKIKNIFSNWAVFYFIKDNDYNEQIVKKEAKLIEDYKKLA